MSKSEERLPGIAIVHRSPTNEERLVEYEICKRRGHQTDGIAYLTNPPQSKCKWCGTFLQIRNSSVIVELNPPTKNPCNFGE